MCMCCRPRVWELNIRCLGGGVGGKRERKREWESERWAAEGCTWHHTHPSCKTPASCCQWRRSVGVGSGRAAACAPIGPCPVRAWSCSWSCGWCESGCHSCLSSWIQSLREERAHHQHTVYWCYSSSYSGVCVCLCVGLCWVHTSFMNGSYSICLKQIKPWYKTVCLHTKYSFIL